jgi:hypothetical protein
MPWASYQWTSACDIVPSGNSTVAIPLSFLHRPLPYSLQSLFRFRMAAPVAMTSTSTIRPTILNSTLRHRRQINLRAPARAAATPAAIARTVPCHDAAAEAAGGSVSEVHDVGQRVGGVNGAATGPHLLDSTGHRSRTFTDKRSLTRVIFSRSGPRLWPQIVKQHLLLSGKAQLEPAEDVIHDRLGVADVGIAAPAAGFEARVRKFFAK